MKKQTMVGLNVTVKEFPRKVWVKSLGEYLPNSIQNDPEITKKPNENPGEMTSEMGPLVY